MFTSFLQLHGFSLGVEDILVMTGADEERQKVMRQCKQCGNEAAAEAFNISGPTNTRKSVLVMATDDVVMMYLR